MTINDKYFIESFANAMGMEQTIKCIEADGGDITFVDGKPLFVCVNTIMQEDRLRLEVFRLDDDGTETNVLNFERYYNGDWSAEFK